MALVLALAPCQTAFAAQAQTGTGAESGSSDPVRIFILDAPYLEWEDIGEDTTPNLYSILDESGMANLIARSSSRDTSVSASADEAASTISRGVWKTSPSSLYTTSMALMAEEYTTSSEYVTHDNGNPYEGRLGQLLQDEGWMTGALGTSDYNYRIVRPAAVTLADEDGYVLFSVTDPDELLDPAGTLPYESTNLVSLEEYLVSILADMDTYSEANGLSGNAVVAVDSGDLYRAGTYRIKYPGDTADAYWSQAVLSFDETVGMVLEQMDSNDILVVYSSLAECSTTSHNDDGYGPLVVYGGGYEGILTSSSTGRDGLVLATDITATIVSIAGSDYSFDNANVITVGEESSGSVDELLSWFEYESDMADAVADSQWLMVALLCIVLVLVFICSAIMFTTRIKLPYRVADVMIIFTRLLWLVTAAFPLATYLMIPLLPQDCTQAMAVSTCIALTLALAVAAVAIGKLSGRWLYSLISLMLATVLVIAIDQLAGAQLARVGYLTYIPEKLGRFSGIGNEGACILFASWMMLSGLVLNRFPDSRASHVFANVLFPIFSACLIAIIVAPWWGSNFGALVWGVVGAFAAWWMFTGRRLSWKVVILTMVGCVALVVLLIVVDSIGGQSHLGLTGSRLASEGLAYIPTIVGNMLRLSVATLYASPPLSLGLALIWLYMAWLRIRKPGPYEVFWKRNSYFKATFTACMIVAVVMLLVEDSGILLPALTLLYCTAGLTWLICDLHRWEFKHVERELGIIEEEVPAATGGFKIEEEDVSLPPMGPEYVEVADAYEQSVYHEGVQDPAELPEEDSEDGI